MIIGDNREAVIKNIARLSESGEFNGKVETNDPVVTNEEGKAMLRGYVQKRSTLGYKIKNTVARGIASVATRIINKDTEIVGAEILSSLDSGAIITSNHFSPLDNTVVRHLTKSLGKKRVNIICQLTNFAMDGFIGFLMNYADTIPIGSDAEYMSHSLPAILSELLENKELVLIYPEKEMWFNYRKPRPTLDGAYHYASKFCVPIISCFVEMIDLDEMDTEDFRKVGYKIHVLGLLYPDKDKSVRENRKALKSLDYQLKKEAYERIYNKKLDYSFEPSDIAGWTGEKAETVINEAN